VVVVVVDAVVVVVVVVVTVVVVVAVVTVVVVVVTDVVVVVVAVTVVDVGVVTGVDVAVDVPVDVAVASQTSHVTGHDEYTSFTLQRGLSAAQSSLSNRMLQCSRVTVVVVVLDLVVVVVVVDAVVVVLVVGTHTSQRIGQFASIKSLTTWIGVSQALTSLPQLSLSYLPLHCNRVVTVVVVVVVVVAVVVVLLVAEVVVEDVHPSYK